MFDSLPLHPMFVHFPIVLTFVVVIYFIITQFFKSHFKWSYVFILSAALFVSSLVAAKLGEEDEELVEHSGHYQSLEQHEDLGEVIPWIASTLVLISIGGLIKPNMLLLKVLFLGAAAVQMGFIIYVSHLGAKLVYEEGAAQVYKLNQQTPKPFKYEDDEDDHD